MMNSFFIDYEAFKSELTLTIDRSKKLLDSKHIAFNKTITDRSLTAFRQIQDRSGISRLVSNMLLESAFKSERTSANSADLMLKFSIIIIKDFLKNDYKTLNLEEDLSLIKDQLEKNKRNLLPEDLPIILESTINNIRIKSMVLEAVSLAGLDGRISTAFTNSGKYSVELVKGYTFNISSYPEFYNENDVWEQSSSRILIIDGVIDRESEIHSLLTKLSEKKGSLLIIARGYSQEVIMTLSKNNNMGVINVLPIRIPFEVDSVNLIADMAIVCDTDIITPLKGDLISGAKLEKLSVIDKVISNKNNLTTIYNDKSAKKVVQHALNLQKKRDEQNYEEMSEILNNRIRSLFSHCVQIKIGSITEQEKKIELELVDYGLRTIKSALAHGPMKVSDLSKYECKTKTMRNILNATKDLDDIKPVMSVYSALYHAVFITSLLLSIRGAILLDSIPT